MSKYCKKMWLSLYFTGWLGSHGIVVKCTAAIFFLTKDWIAPLHWSRLGREVCWYHEDVLCKSLHAIDCLRELDEHLIKTNWPTENCRLELKTWRNLSTKCTAKQDLAPLLNFDGSSFDQRTWTVRCCNHARRRHSHAWQILFHQLPRSSSHYRKMAGVSTKYHTFPLCACLSLHPQLLLRLPSAAASQTALDALAVSRTEFHARLL